jgi:CDI immunity proteins
MPGRTLEQLEGQTGPKPDFDSHVVETCHRLRTKPLEDFTVEDLRIMIGQEIGLVHLLPLAIEILNDDPALIGIDSV